MKILLQSLALLLCSCAQTPRPAIPPTLEQQLAAEIDQYAQVDRASSPPPCQVLFVGSSSIVLWKTLADDMAPLAVLNRGFGGAHIEHVNRWFNQIVVPYQPRAIVFYAGENDIAAGKSASRVVADFDAFMTRKSQAMGAVPVYFISLKPSKLRFRQLGQQTEVNQAIQARAAHRADLHYIDVAASMLENGRPKELFQADGLHMTAEGYDIWAQAVRAALFPNAETEGRICYRSGRSDSSVLQRE